MRRTLCLYGVLIWNSGFVSVFRIFPKTDFISEIYGRKKSSWQKITELLKKKENKRSINKITEMLLFISFFLKN